MTNGLTGASQDRTQLTVAAMSDTEDLLAILNEHGQKFLNCFGSTGPQQPKSKKRKLSHTEDVLKPTLRTSSEESEQDDESEVEWDGFSGVSSSNSVRDEEEEDDFLVADRSNASVVVFSDPSSSTGKQREDETSTLKKQFMVCSLVSVRTLFC